MTRKLIITRERLQEIAEDGFLKHGESKELARMALAAMDSEPVAKQVACWSCRNKVEISAIGDCDGHCPNCNSPIDLDEEPYTAPQSAPDRDQVRREHAEWSQATFGNIGPIGPLKHLSKEALEAAAEPGDLSEWADMQFLLWDAQRRAGITDDQITQAMIEKLAVNKQREWPEPKDGDPRLHIKEQPTPVVTLYRDGIEAAAKWIDRQREAYDSEHGRHDLDTGSFEFGNDAQREYSSTLEELAEGIRALHPNAGNSPVVPDAYVRDERGRMMLNGVCEPKIGFGSGWNACRAAMLQHQPQNAQQNIPENIPGGLVEAVNNLLNNDGSRGCYDAMECGTAREKIELWLAQRQRWEEQRKANLSAGNSPVIPDGYMIVPKQPTAEMIAAAMNCDDVLFNSDESFCVQFGNIYEAMLAAAPQEVKGE